MFDRLKLLVNVLSNCVSEGESSAGVDLSHYVWDPGGRLSIVVAGKDLGGDGSGKAL
jgi:hypothetical protein